MRNLLPAVFLLCCANVSFGQFALAPNPGCANNAPYCRIPISLSTGGPSLTILGTHNGVLYGWVLISGYPPATCPSAPSGSPVNSTPTFCFYATSTFSTENWTFKGQDAQRDAAEVPYEIVFGPGSCTGIAYKYIYTTGKRILRATDADTDWSFTDIGSSNLPNLPQDTGARIGSFAIGSSTAGQMRLFYGNYNGHRDACPQALIWHSDDCGTTWASPVELALPNPSHNSVCRGPAPPTPPPNPPATPPPGYSDYYHAREVHAIEVDPANTSNIYAFTDTEFSDSQPYGLWRSTDGGYTFTHLTPFFQNALVGIDFVFPAASNKIFLENDAAIGGGVLLSQDKGIGDPVGVAAQWPTATPAWGGSSSAIKLTSEQNIFLITNHDFSAPPNNLYRSGIWYLAPPFYNYPLLLEDLAPPISSITASNGVATVITSAPHGLQHSTDPVGIAGVSPAIFNSPVDQGENPLPIPGGVTITGPSSFNYSCPGCPSYGTGGVAQREDLFWGFRTSEVTDPDTHLSYLYINNQKIPKPIFFMWKGSGELPGDTAAFGSPLSGFMDSSGNAYFLYVSSNQAEVVSYVNGVWQSMNLSAFNGTAAPVSQIVQPSPGAFYYLDANGKLNGVYAPASWNGGVWTGSGELPGDPAGPGSPLAGFMDSTGALYFLYRYSSNQAEVVSYTGTWQSMNLSAFNGTAAPVSQIVQPSPGAFYYLDANGKLNGVYAPASWNGGVWTGSGELPGDPADPGSPLAGFMDSTGALYFLYRYSSNQAEVVSYTGTWQSMNLSVYNGTAAPVSQIIQPSSGSFYYLDANGKLNGVYPPASWNGGVWTGSGELPGDPAASGSPLAGAVDSAGNLNFLYRNTSNLTEVVSYVNGVWLGNNLSAANGTAAPVSQIIQPNSGAFYYLDSNGKLNGVYAPTH